VILWLHRSTNNEFVADIPQVACLFQICFDNSHRLCRKTYVFEYKGVAFKLIQNDPRKRADHLLTIIPSYSDPARLNAFAKAAEFLSALAWETGARAKLWEVGAAAWPEDWPIEKARPCIFEPPRIPLMNALGYDLVRIPKIKTLEQRIALSLFREANASNNDYLSLIFYWQVLEVGCGSKADGFVNKTYGRRPNSLGHIQSDIALLQLGRRRLGDYLRDDCRNAVAHIRRKLGRTSIDLDEPEDRWRIAISVRIIKAFAAYYIRESLELNEHLYLARRRHRDVPIFLDSEAMRNQGLLRHVLSPLPLLRRGLTGRSKGRYGSGS
jgi:hypothetical protein